MHKLCFYVPANALQRVKQAVFDAGAGRQGNYEHCCWQTAGTGQFRPLAGSNPALGEHDQLEYVTEYKVEMLCPDELIGAVVSALRDAHPFEEPAFDLIPLRGVDDL